MLRQINSRQEMIEFIKSTKNHFSNQENWEEWFGFELKWDEDTGEILETIDEYINRGGTFRSVPESWAYPIVISYINETDRDRFGSSTICVWDWIPIWKE